MLASRRRRAQLIDETSARVAGPLMDRSPGDVTATLPGFIGSALSDGDPAEVAVARESVHLALATVIRHLPPKQRSVLLLREMLHWRAAEVAELLDTSVASVNSALQRARATLRHVRVTPIAASAADVDDETRRRLGPYLRALESSDMEALTALLAHEAA
jgi:RNA polymerase sigma-70 factor (ECF subfamily)